MTTAADLIGDALRACGAWGQGQAAPAEDSAIALRELNRMLAKWSAKRLLVHHLRSVGFRTTGAIGYAIAPGAAVDFPRPHRIQSAYARQGNGVPWPLDVVQAREDFAGLTMLPAGGMPGKVLLDPAYPQAVVYLWPALASGWTVFLQVKAPLGKVAAVGDTLMLPDEYEDAIVWNLAARLRAYYALAPDPTIAAHARDALAAIRQANSTVPRLAMPAGLPGMRGGWVGGYWGTSPTGSLVEGDTLFVLDQSTLDGSDVLG